jgi:DNA repair protein RadC
MPQVTSPRAFKPAFEHGPNVKGTDPKAAPREIPQYRVNGTVIKTPADFAKTLVSLRSPYSESLKMAIVDKDNRVIHRRVLASGRLDI